MDKDISKLRKTILLMKKEGVSSLKTAEGIEIRIEPAFLVPKRTRKTKVAEPGSETIVESPYSETDMLFWSSPEGVVTNG